MRRLTDLFNHEQIYARIYQILSLEDRLPPANEIIVLEPNEYEPSPGLWGQVMAVAMRGNKLWFREYPPDALTYAHELIHLARKRSSIDEEVYAYNLANLIVTLGERGIIPRVNPLRLFEDLSLADLANVLARRYGLSGDRPIDIILAYFELRGVIPAFAELDVSSDGLRLVPKEGFTDVDILVNALAEIISIAHLEEESLALVLELLGLLGKGVAYAGRG